MKQIKLFDGEYLEKRVNNFLSDKYIDLIDVRISENKYSTTINFLRKIK